MRYALIFVITLFSPFTVLAHSSSESYVNLRAIENTLTGSWQVAVSDLELSVGVDMNNDGKITWGELDTRKSIVIKYVQSGLQVLQSGRPCLVTVSDVLVEKKHRGIFAYFPMTVSCKNPVDIVEFRYSLLFDKDYQHHIAWAILHNKEYYTGVASSIQPDVQINMKNSDWLNGFKDYLLQGVWHIWNGMDHIIFILLLIFCIEKALRSNTKIHNVKWLRIMSISKTITSFTVAHSITLALAVMGWVSVSSMWVESVIALSVVLTGLNYIFGWVREKLWLFAVLFGLIHGFGFASGLLDLGLDGQNVIMSLAAFNVGVEAGQIVIILVSLPILITIYSFTSHTKRIMECSTWGIVLLASVWFVERLAM